MGKWYPRLYQGGMGVDVSGHRLAQAVSLSDDWAVGVVSGVAGSAVFARKLQLGDPSGDYRRALSQFPGNRQLVEEVLEKYFRPNGLGPGEKFASIPPHSDKPSRLCLTLDVLAGFCEIWLAKDVGGGKKVKIGLNLLEKTQTSLVPYLFGAMLAGVDFVLMGAGIPIQIPNVLKQLSRFEKVSYRLNVEKALQDDSFSVDFDPNVFGIETNKKLKVPLFGAIVSSYVLAKKMQDVGADFLIFEGHRAGGHNSPPRSKRTNPDGSPEYGEKDEVDWEKVMRDIVIPYYIAGSYATRADRWEFARSVGARGIQAGSIFALSDESNIDENIKAYLRSAGYEGTLRVRCDSRFSSSGYPFEIAEIPDTLSEKDVLAGRKRLCNLSFLRTAYRKDDGTIGWRCPAEPIENYLKKGGAIEDCTGRGCLCNALLATVGLGGAGELPVATLGPDLGFLKDMMSNKLDHYSAKEAVRFLLKGIL